MIAAPLVLKLRTVVFSFLNLRDDDAEPEAAATTRDQDWHLANGTSGTTAPSEVIFTLREPQPIVEFAIDGPLPLVVRNRRDKE